MRLCLPHTSDQHLYTQASLCCHTGINWVLGCVNHSKPQKIHPHTQTHTYCIYTHYCQPAIPCSYVSDSEGPSTEQQIQKWILRSFLEEWRENEFHRDIQDVLFFLHRDHPVIPVLSIIHHWCSGWLHINSAGSNPDTSVKQAKQKKKRKQ